MLKILKKYFGYTKFRGEQENVIKNVLNGNDCLVLMPTGGGKSLCYQLPALMLPGLTIVISPLIALMKNQVDFLKERGIEAEFINSSLSQEQIEAILEKIKSKKIKLLYIAPERFAVSDFRDFLKSLEVSLVAVDEAHCISTWGHEFRKDYRELGLLKKEFPSTPIIALTATATERVKDDILDQLRITKAKVFSSSFNRENLEINITDKINPLPQLINYLNKHKNKAAIIYCQSRKEAEEISKNLNLNKMSSRCYHAGLDSNERKLNQELFIDGDIDVIVATIAFGMGIDKSDVRLVVHYSFPKTLENYYQEIGRAGRDGKQSECVLFYDHKDDKSHKFFINQIKDEYLKIAAEEKLAEVIDYCELTTCRKVSLMDYFGESLEKDCQMCDACLNTRVTIDITKEARIVLLALKSIKENIGKNHFVDFLLGKRTQRMIREKYDEVHEFGNLKELKEHEVGRIIDKLINQSLILIENEKYPRLKITRDGNEFLLKNKSFEIDKTDTLPGKDNPDEQIAKICKEKFYDKTRKLVSKKISIDRIAKNQDLKISEAVNHIEKLLDDDEDIDVDYLRLPRNRYFEMCKGFDVYGDEELKPVFEGLHKRFTYDELRLVRVLRFAK